MDPEEVEQRDAERVDQAIQHIENGDVSLAYELLSDVVTRAPAHYTYQYEEGDTLFVKFWDNREFMHYVFWQQSQGRSRNVTWVKSAYPRACYYLGYLEIEAGRYDDALRFLEFGRSLEPTNPALAIEQAHALALAGRYFEACRLYDEVQTPGPHVRGEHVARALRGKGWVLTERGALGSAEKCYRKSQEYEPDNEVAAKELEYISSVLAEKRASGSEPSSEFPEPEREDESSQSSSGANHWSSIGFPLETSIELLELAAQAAKNGVPIEAGRGTYIRWSTSVGAELWAQADPDGNLMGLNPHYSGDAKLRVRLEDRIVYPGAPVLDGAFYGWANPDSSRAERGDYPLVFDTPDYDLHRLLELPAVMDVQLSAFARELHAFGGETEYRASRWGETFAAESFVPSGLFKPDGESVDPPQADAIFVGHVLGTSLLTNPVTGAEFYWARVRTLGGEVDVVADPKVLRGSLVEGGVVWGWFWLSGRLLVHAQAK